MTDTPAESNSILIVDDNPTNLDVLFDCLDKTGFEVFVAEDGQSAIEQLNYTKPDLILLDVMMPGLDGFETCRRLKADPHAKHIPIIFMTALTETEDKVTGFKVGAVDYVTKPLQYEEVIARVNTHLTLRNLQQDLQQQNSRLQGEIEQRKQTENKLQQKTLELRTRNEDLDAFARTVAHDLKAPLNVILGFAQIIQVRNKQGRDISGKQAEYLQAILQSAYQMNNITDELLLLARLRHTEVKIVPLDMATIVARSQERLMYMIEEHQAEVVVPSTWPVTVGYASWIEHVWVNYLSNALKYGGRPPRVELGAEVLPDQKICFWIRDNGGGLTADEQTQLFAEFTQLKQARPDGQGLGLSIVKRIITKLGGEVGVRSCPGQGSTFYFTLPQTEAPLP